MKFAAMILVFGLSSLMTVSAASKTTTTEKTKTTSKTAQKTDTKKTDTKKAETKQTEAIDNPFEDYQKEIESCQKKLKAAKTSSQKKAALKALQLSQKN